jgi:hypothetical protein
LIEQEIKAYKDFKAYKVYKELKVFRAHCLLLVVVTHKYNIITTDC